MARSLLGEPKVVLLDEPTAALGVAQTATVLELIKRLRERGLGVVVISHNLADVFEVADRVFVLRLGRPAGTFDVARRAARMSSRRSPGRTRDEKRKRHGTAGMSTTSPPAPTGLERPTRGEILRRFVQGDLASLRVILGVVVIWIIFQSQNDRFLTALNLTNLMLQITAVGLISVGVVYVLLLGEIDLSVGAVSGLAAAVMAVLNVKHGWDPYLAIAAGVACGIAIGLVQGALFTSFGIPSFVVTLAGLLIWQGALLYVLGDTGTINITDSKITGLANTFYSDAVGWTMALVAIGVYAAATLWAWRQRVAAGLADSQLTGPLIRIVVVAAAVIAAVAVLNADRGVPLAVLILVGFVAGMEYVARRTRFGRHVYAVGGNAEAARRAGISVHADPRDRVRDRRVHGGDRRHHAGVAAAGREPRVRAETTCSSSRSRAR